MRSQVTTKRGDAGKTLTIGGEELSKSHPVLEACGEVDTLRAYLALCRLEVLASDRADAEELGEFVFWLLHVCFLIGAECNDPKNLHPEYRKEAVGAGHLRKLETIQQALEAQVSLPRQCVVSAASPLAARFDLACTYARRLERRIVALAEAEPAFQGADILVFMNRLSDTLYMVARRLDDGASTTVDYGVLDD